jgi:hypothetical protein
MSSHGNSPGQSLDKLPTLEKVDTVSFGKLFRVMADYRNDHSRVLNVSKGDVVRVVSDKQGWLY